MFALTGKSCVVTGASRGLGRAIALAFADQGADLVLAARSRGDLEQVPPEEADRDGVMLTPHRFPVWSSIEGVWSS